MKKVFKDNYSPSEKLNELLDYENDDIGEKSHKYGGYDSDDIEELACQGVNPWDPDADAVLAVLNGEIGNDSENDFY